MRRILALLLLFAMLLSACGPSEDDEPIPGLDVTPTPGSPAVSTPDSGSVTISFAAWDVNRDQFQQLADRFHEENPSITVVIVPMEDFNSPDPNAPQDPISQLRRMVSGADTSMMYYVPPEAASANLMLDLKPLMDADASFQQDDFYPGALSRGSYTNGSFLLPRYIYTQVLYYNKDLFEKAELPAPAANWTWNDLLGNAEQIASTNPDAYGFFDYSNGFTSLLAEIEQGDLNVLTTPAADVDLTQPSLVELYTRLKQRFDDRTLLNTNYQEGQPDPQQLVRDGRVALFPAEIVMDGGPRPMDSGAQSNATQADLPFEVGKIAYPQLPSAYSSNGVEGYIISSGTQHPSESWKWIEWLSRQPLSDEAAANSPGRIPARDSLAQAIGYWDSIDAETKAAYQAALAQQVVVSTTSPDYTVVGPLSQAVYDMLSGTEPEEALRSAQTTLEDQLAQMANATPTPEPETGPVVVATPAPQTAPEGAATVVFDASGFDPSMFRRLAREFNTQNPNLFVRINATQAMTQPLTLTNSAATADCFVSWNMPQTTADFASLLDLRPLFEADATFKSDDYPAALLSQFSSNGGIYALPYSFNVRNLSYNKTLFDSTGASTPTGDWTPDDFLNAAKALTSGNGNTKVYGYVPYGGGPAGDMTFFINQFGGPLSTGSGTDTKPVFSDPKTVAAIQWYIDLAKVHGVMPEFTIPYRPEDTYDDQSYTLVTEGRAGMWLDYGYGSFTTGGKDGNGQDLSWEPAFAPLPIGAYGLQNGDIWARGYYISAKSEQAQGCWEWLKYLSNDVSSLNGDLPARTSIAASEEFRSTATEAQLAIYDVYKDALNKPTTPIQGMAALYTATNYGIDMYWFYQAINNNITDDADLATGLAKAEELTKAHIACVAETSKPATCAKQVDPDYNGYNTEDPDPNQPIYAAG